MQTLPALEELTDTDAVIARLRSRIDGLDAEILRLLDRRRELSGAVQQARIAAGGRRTAFGRENEIIKRYADRLGRPGGAIAMTVLEICRGTASAPAGGTPR
ncbi:chorismate mutase [Streptomyces sp. NPDC005263]|uniref:chorismate mutase n=1 Tax=Streptomyces sp. NPDC005263 TaxID=3364711 RepID=UPI003689BDC0